MARELVQKNVDGKLYEFQQLNPTQSLKLLSKLSTLIGEPAMLVMAAGAKSFLAKKKGEKVNLADVVLDNDMLQKAIAGLVMRMGDDENVLWIVTQLASQNVLCDHKAIVFDVHYEGELGHLFKVVRAALEVQYGNFIGVLFASAGVSPILQSSQGIQSA